MVPFFQKIEDDMNELPHFPLLFLGQICPRFLGFGLVFVQNLVGKVVQVSPNLTPLKALLWNNKLAQDKFKILEKQDSSTCKC